MPTVATGPPTTLIASSARHGVDAKAMNRTVSLNAFRTLGGLEPGASKAVPGFGAKCMASWTVKTQSPCLLEVHLTGAHRSSHSGVETNQNGGSVAAPPVNLA